MNKRTKNALVLNDYKKYKRRVLKQLIKNLQVYKALHNFLNVKKNQNLDTKQKINKLRKINLKNHSNLFLLTKIPETFQIIKYCLIILFIYIGTYEKHTKLHYIDLIRMIVIICELNG